MITAQDAKRIALDSGYLTEVMAGTENQIVRSAIEGKTSTAMTMPSVGVKADQLKKLLKELGYRIDETETLNGIFKPGVLIRVSWD